MRKPHAFWILLVFELLFSIMSKADTIPTLLPQEPKNRLAKAVWDNSGQYILMPGIGAWNLTSGVLEESLKSQNCGVNLEVLWDDLILCDFQIINWKTGSVIKQLPENFSSFEWINGMVAFGAKDQIEVWKLAESSPLLSIPMGKNKYRNNRYRLRLSYDGKWFGAQEELHLRSYNLSIFDLQNPEKSPISYQTNSRNWEFSKDSLKFVTIQDIFSNRDGTNIDGTQVDLYDLESGSFDKFTFSTSPVRELVEYSKNELWFAGHGTIYNYDLGKRQITKAFHSLKNADYTILSKNKKLTALSGAMDGAEIWDLDTEVKTADLCENLCRERTQKIVSISPESDKIFLIFEETTSVRDYHTQINLAVWNVADKKIETMLFPSSGVSKSEAQAQIQSPKSQVPKLPGFTQMLIFTLGVITALIIWKSTRYSKGREPSSEISNNGFWVVGISLLHTLPAVFLIQYDFVLIRMIYGIFIGLLGLIFLLGIPKARLIAIGVHGLTAGVCALVICSALVSLPLLKIPGILQMIPYLSLGVVKLLWPLALYSLALTYFLTRTGFKNDFEEYKGLKIKEIFSSYRLIGLVPILLLLASLRQMAGQESEISIPSAHSSVAALQSHPSLDLVATSGTKDDVKIWDLKTLKKVHSIHRSIGAKAIAFDTAGNLLAIGYQDGFIDVWTTNPWKKIASWNPGLGRIEDILFMKTSRTVIFSTNKATILAWDLDKQSVIFQFKSYLPVTTSTRNTESEEPEFVMKKRDEPGSVGRLDLSDDQKSLIAGEPYVPYLYSLPEGTIIHRFEDSGYPVFFGNQLLSLKPNPYENQIYEMDHKGSMGRMLAKSDLDKKRSDFKARANKINEYSSRPALTFSRDQNALALRSVETIEIWDPRQFGKPFTKIWVRNPTKTEFSADRKKMLVADGDGRIYVFDSDSGKLLGHLHE